MKTIPKRQGAPGTDQDAQIESYLMAEAKMKTIPKSQGDPGADEDAQIESNLLEQGKINDHKRVEFAKDIFSKIVLVAFIALSFALALMGFCVLFHYVTPTNWHYLEPQQVGRLESIVFSVFITAFANNTLKKYL